MRGSLGTRDLKSGVSTGEDEWPIKIVVKAVGLQEVNANEPTVQEIDLGSDEKVWVFNCSTHTNEDGNPFHPKNSPFIWMGNMKSKKGSSHIACDQLASTVSPRKLTPSALHHLLQALKNSYLNNFPSPLLVLGVHALHLHYEILLQLHSAGPAETVGQVGHLPYHFLVVHTGNDVCYDFYLR